MPQSVDLIFSDFVPDRGGAPWPENPGYLIDAVNVRFTPNGYRSTYLDAVRAASPTALSATALAAVGYANVTTPRHYVGTATKLYESDDFGGTWNDNAGAAYSASDWDFAVHGTTIVAVNINDNPQEKDLSDPVGTNFADLGGTPPKAARVARIRDNLVLGDLLADHYGLRWSKTGDPTVWSTPGSAAALADGSGSVSLGSEYGFVTKLVGGEKFGLVFQERAITRMTYVGGDIQFNFDVYEKGQGTGFSHSAIRIGNLIYFANSTGFYQTDGYTVSSISLGKLDDSFVQDLLDHPRASATIGNGVAYDHRLKLVCWPVTTSGGTDLLVCYDIALQQFKIVDLVGTLLDGTLYSVHDGASFQDAFVVPHCIDEDNKLRQFSVLTDVPTLLRTGFVEFIPGVRTEIKGIEPLGAALTNSLQISVLSVDDPTKITLADEGYEPAQRAVMTDQYKVRTSGRFHSFRYADPAQTQAALIRGLRVYFEIKSGR